MRERALREMGLAPGWVRRRANGPADAGISTEVALERVNSPDASALDLEGLRSAIGQCEACPRALARKRAVPGEGPAAVQLMVVDHVPSRSDAEHGALSEGEPARLFEQLVFALGLKREAIYLSHALRCDGDAPTALETSCCAPYLARELALLAPRALLAFGSATADAIRAGTPGDAPRIFVIEHPARLLNDAAGKRHSWMVLRELRAYLAAG